MNILVVYDSFFGNTERIARALGAALGEAQGAARGAARGAAPASAGGVRLKRASEAGPEDLRGLELLILGSPTRAFSPSKDAKAFLAAIPARGLEGLRTAAFDTRIAAEETGSRLLSLLVRLFGYAAESLEKGLARKGGKAAAPAQGFFVKASEGPLKEGELERAEAWARSLLA